MPARGAAAVERAFARELAPRAIEHALQLIEVEPGLLLARGADQRLQRGQPALRAVVQLFHALRRRRERVRKRRLQPIPQPVQRAVEHLAQERHLQRQLLRVGGHLDAHGLRDAHVRPADHVAVARFDPEQQHIAGFRTDFVRHEQRLVDEALLRLVVAR